MISELWKSAVDAVVLEALMKIIICGAVAIICWVYLIYRSKQKYFMGAPYEDDENGIAMRVIIAIFVAVLGTIAALTSIPQYLYPEIYVLKYIFQ